MIGSTIAHYKIIEKLGEGGMGVVYKAEDIKLKRIVALKFIPHHLTLTKELNAQLLNEAQMTAKLNHPHICTIYDIEEAEGEKFIVMEFVDGITLRKKIKENPLSIVESVNYAIQIGEALEEAHSQGIIHSDIKPDNVMINSKNQIKVMDFGIAKLKEGFGVTRTMNTSGTVSYMAPEQLSNSKMDGRVDIFSLGILLYEMLSSKLPFRGEHQAAMMYSIMNEEPEPINKYLSEVPSEILHVLNRALEKDPEERYQNVHDLVIDLRRLKKHTSGIKHHTLAGENITTDSDQKINSSAKTKSTFKKYLIFIILGVAILIVFTILFILPSNSILINPEMNSHAISIPFTQVEMASMSSDGKWVVFPARNELGKYDVYMMNLSDKQVRKITPGSGEWIHSAIISPDVSTIIYSRGAFQRKIYSVSTSSGEEKMIMEGYGLIILQYFPDGKKILYVKLKDLNTSIFRTELWSSNVYGTDEHLYFVDTIKNIRGWRLSYNLSQDGKRVAWIKNFNGYSELMVRDLENGTDLQLTNDKKYTDRAYWTSTEQIIYSSNRSGNWNLWMIDSRGGDPIQITRGGGSDYLIGISNDDKRILYTQSSSSNHIKIGSLVNGSIVQLTTEELPRGYPVISPSKTRIIFTQTEVSIEGVVHNNIYSMDINEKNIKRITNDNKIKLEPSWSPDEKWIAYSAYSSNENVDSSRIFLIPSDGSAKPKMVGFGTWPFWINDRKFTYLWKLNTYMHLIDTEITEKISADSLALYFIMKEKYVFVYDYHKAKLGWWIVDMNSYKESGTKKARLILKGSTWYDCIANDKLYYILEPTTNLNCISLPDGKKIPMKHIQNIYTFDISKDGKEIVFNTRFARNTFTLLENPFK